MYTTIQKISICNIFGFKNEYINSFIQQDTLNWP